MLRASGRINKFWQALNQLFARSLDEGQPVSAYRVLHGFSERTMRRRLNELAQLRQLNRDLTRILLQQE